MTASTGPGGRQGVEGRPWYAWAVQRCQYKHKTNKQTVNQSHKTWRAIMVFFDQAHLMVVTACMPSSLGRT